MVVKYFGKALVYSPGQLPVEGWGGYDGGAVDAPMAYGHLPLSVRRDAEVEHDDVTAYRHSGPTG